MIVNFVHIPVLLKEVIDLMRPKSGGRYFDGTLGGGGYAKAILDASAPDGKLLAVDVDDAAIAAAADHLKDVGDRVKMERASYANVATLANGEFAKFDGMVLDLGVSSFQFDEGSRGFSFSKDAPLDMRMDKQLTTSAAELVNGLPGEELERIFKELGEERFAGRIVRRILEARRTKEITTTKELEKFCYLSYPPPMRRGRTHPATRVFQALRIAVNGELDNLRIFLEDAPQLLNEGGRIVVVSYHSLEDRIVKEVFKSKAFEGGFKVITKKPITPTEAEMNDNPRSRSAKLRVIEKE